eukprot:scaffold70486_cov35-Tisochrysis_lutea.AAC.1
MPLPRIIKKLDDRTRASLSHRYLTNSPFDRCDESGWSIRASGNRTHEGGGKQTYLQKMSISDSIVLDLVGPSSSPNPLLRVEALETATGLPPTARKKASIVFESIGD